MKITKIEVQKKNLDRFSIFIDGEFAFGLTDELVYKFKLKKGMELDQKLLDEILDAERLNKAVNYTVYLLSFRQRSEKELRDKLIEKEYLDHQIEYAINYCKEHKYIDDRSFAESFIKDKMNLSKHGSRKVKYDLKLKGVDDSIINEVIENSEVDEYEIALNLAKKRISRYESDDKYTQYRKLGGYLSRRGYPYDIVNKVLNELIDR